MPQPKSHQGTDEITYQSPQIPSAVDVHDVPIVKATDESLKGYGSLVDDPQIFTVENGSFVVCPGHMRVGAALIPARVMKAAPRRGPSGYSGRKELFGENLALATTANKYLLGLGALPDQSAEPDSSLQSTDSRSVDQVYVWYSDYHPDGGQMFFSQHSPFVANLAPALGDTIRPKDFTAFYVEAGKGLYIHPGIWHKAVHVKPEHAPTDIFGRQG